ncbi:hypothetical protein COCOBI_16-0170 [Coccomyxa sp. Obi]|nr:hypothetical protein COCOBI_16-0170 [Coccomyxa sp. Obi]
MGAIARAERIQKDHKSAIAIVPPRHLWPEIQEIRFRNDKSFLRWPPHINLLYPFYEDVGTTFESSSAVVQEAVAGISAFQVQLADLRYFEHGRSCTLWLDPHCDQLMQLQAALVAAFPDCTDLSDDPSRNISSFAAHLSLGQWRSPGDVKNAQQVLQQKWQPLAWTVGSVCLLSRAGFIEPFVVRYTVPLGGGGPAREVNAPYVASFGLQPLPSRVVEGAEEFEEGAGQQGAWYFAYGANMCTGKLTGSRGITPLEAVPGCLRGWRLSFNHRGAMGNLMQNQDSKGSVHGVLYRISNLDMARLTHMEHEYRPTEVEVEEYDGRQAVRALAFISPPDLLIPEGMPPADRYLKLLQDGAREWRLDSGYSAWLDSLPSVPSRSRGPDYYTSPSGAPVKGLPRIWTGGDSVDAWGRRQSSRGRGGRSGRGRGSNRGSG